MLKRRLKLVGISRKAIAVGVTMPSPLRNPIQSTLYPRVRATNLSIGTCRAY